MKKILALLLAVAMIFALTACGGGSTAAEDDSGSAAAEDAGGSAAAEDDGGSIEDAIEEAAASGMKIAMITDYGDITDQSFNQTTYEACKAYADTNGLGEDGFKYYKPASDSDADRVTMIETAIDEGYNVIEMPGYAFANAIKETAGSGDYDDITFIALDVGAGDLGEDFEVPANLYCATYQEELCGYMAGYAAVKLGYTKLGFLGGMAVPAVVRYGYGFIQGADAAAAELELTDVEVNYLYGNTFGPDPAVKAAMDTWFANGTEVVFACGGGIYISAAEAAQSAGGKIIGVDVDQKGIIDGSYGEGITVTSAMKGLAATVNTMLTVVADGTFSDYGGKIDTLGLVSENPEENYVQLGSTQWADGFTEDDYNALVADMFNGVITVSSDTTVTASDCATVITVNDQGSL